MSEYKCPVTKILAVENHPNADRLDICTVYGFRVVASKGKYKVGDRILYIPIDSIIPTWLEERLFPPGLSKFKLTKSRIRQIKIRHFASQGLLVDFEDIESHLDPEAYKDDSDLSTILGITKYEPEVHDNTPRAATPRNKPKENPYFRKYNGITNIKWILNPFKDEEVVIQDKLHGSHIRFGRAPFVPNTLWKKIIKFFRLAPKYESVYGSNNVELTNRKGNKGFYGSDIYGAALENINAFELIEDGTFVHAELIGPGIQKNYTYSLDEHSIVVFDIRILQEDGTQKWLNPEEAEKWALDRGFEFVPILYKGIFTEEILDLHTSGKSMYCDKEVREGCVVKSRINYDNQGDKNCYKSINPEYLADVTNSDNH